MSILSPYLDNLPNWKDILPYKHLLFDTDAIISIIEFKAESLCKELKKQNVEFCIIHPVYIEIIRTENTAKRIERQEFINTQHFTTLPLTKAEMEKGIEILTYLLANKTYTASPTDLYLGGRLATYSGKNIFLLTSNLRDFPHPLYTRETGIILQSQNGMKILSVLSLNGPEFNKLTNKVSSQE